MLLSHEEKKKAEWLSLKALSNLISTVQKKLFIYSESLSSPCREMGLNMEWAMFILI